MTLHCNEENPQWKDFAKSPTIDPQSVAHSTIPKKICYSGVRRANPRPSQTQVGIEPSLEINHQTSTHDLYWIPSEYFARLYPFRKIDQTPRSSHINQTLFPSSLPPVSP
ncbi:hypothetical protein DID88_008093 [Monilinia fructigena]|uniref:Uncharacterized protein n=1 Tax=Monilinia fructigena TaxID=38457 RepID=A0A395J6Q0_9HELO|nr:hypothetical protein DID88_008093 [Monilinia fructigena]